MKNAQSNHQRFDLEQRTLVFAKDVQLFLQCLPRTSGNAEQRKQLHRSSGSIGANYIEANDALGPNDFMMRMRISRKEAKEAQYWLNLIAVDDESLEQEHSRLCQEACELRLILSAIIRNVLKKQSSTFREKFQDTSDK